jgi:hypothetical protein
MPAPRVLSRAQRDVAAGAPLIPKEYANRIANGENRIAVICDWKDVTQGLILQRTELSQSYLSELMNGKRTGTIFALRQIARALDVPLELILPTD